MLVPSELQPYPAESVRAQVATLTLPRGSMRSIRPEDVLRHAARDEKAASRPARNRVSSQNQVR